MNATRRMWRYVIPVDDQPHIVLLTPGHNPVACAPSDAFSIEFWAEHTENMGQFERTFQVFGTGQPLPGDARWVGTCPRTNDGLVWHLYELDGAR